MFFKERVIRILSTGQRIFSEILGNRIYAFWLCWSLLSAILTLSCVVSIYRRVVFYLPVNMMTVGVIILVLVWSAKWAVDFRAEYMKTSSGHLMLLFSVPILFLVSAVLFPLVTSIQTYGNGGTEILFVTSQFDKDIPRQLFSDVNLHGQMSEDLSHPFYKEKPAYIFYRLGCPYCRASIPKILSSLSREQKEELVFVNLDDTYHVEVGKQLGVEKAATLVAYQQDKNGQWQRKVVRLAGGKEDAPTFYEESLHLLQRVTEKGTE